MVSPLAAARFDKFHPATDEQAIEHVLAGETAYFEILMRRHNELVYRVLRARISDESRIEDAMQRTYLSSYRGLAKFERRAKFSTWLVRIAIRESYRDKPNLRVVEPAADANGATADGELDESHPDHPEQRMHAAEVAEAIQGAADQLPETLKMTFVLRDVQQLSTSETAAILDIDERAVRVRLHRARGRLRELLRQEYQLAVPAIFAFHDPRCHRVVAAVLAQLMPGVSRA